MAIQLVRLGDTITVKDTELGAPNGDPEVVYTLQLLTRAVYKEIYKRYTKPRPNRRSGQMEDRTEWDAVSEDLLDYVLQGWEGILDGGQPAECTRENKLRIDAGRTTAMVEMAGLSQVQNVVDQKASSFRGAETVR